MQGALSNGLVRWTAAQIPLISDKIIFPPGWWARFRKWGVFATFSTNVVWRTAHIFQTYISLPSQKILVVYVYPSLYVLTLNIIMVMRKSWPKPKKISFLCFPHDHHRPIQSLVQHLRATFQHNSLRQKAHCQPQLTQAICIIVNLPPAIIEDHFSSIEWSKSQNRLKIELSNCLWNVLYFYTIGNSNFAVGQGHWQCFDFGSVFFS